jgi:eukaryotic-like serine/threonine-protein kinase
VVKRRVGRYVVYESFARGGMATVHLGRLVADRGFSRLVAVKMATSAGTSMHARALEEEARIVSRIRHPNVVQSLDFLADGSDLFVVMEYVHGVALSQLLGTSGDAPLPAPIVTSLMSDVLKGLHAAHEAVDEHGRLLGVVHRDVSPHNILVGVDGVARLADFGIAKVMRSVEHTETGFVKGKLSYMPPEQLRGLPLTRQADVFSAGTVLAECVSGISPNPAADDPTAWLVVALGAIPKGPLLDVIKIATHADPRQRYANAAEMAAALATAVPPARADQVVELVTRLAGDVLDVRSELVRRVEADPIDDLASSPVGHPIVDQTELLPSSDLITLDPAPMSPGRITPAPMAVPPPAARRRRSARPRRALLFMSGAILTLLSAVAWSQLRHPEAPAAIPIAEAVAAPSPPPSASVGPSLAVPAAPAPSLAVAEPPSGGGPSATEPPAAPEPAPRPSSSANRRRRTGHASPDCQPPFRIDADGRKHYKPECLM